MNGTNHNGLLERIHGLVGCYYLSDLHGGLRPIRGKIRSAINQIKTENYSLEEWTDAVIYITAHRCKFESIEDAVNYLMDYLSSMF